LSSHSIKAVSFSCRRQRQGKCIGGLHLHGEEIFRQRASRESASSSFSVAGAALGWLFGTEDGGEGNLRNRRAGEESDDSGGGIDGAAAKPGRVWLGWIDVSGFFIFIF